MIIMLPLLNLYNIGSLEDTDCHTVFGYVIHDCNSNTSVALSYPVKNGSGKIETGRSFHHGRFVSGLRKQAIKEPKYITNNFRF